MEKINSTSLPNGMHSGIFPLQEEEGRGNNVQICISKLHTTKYLTLYPLCGILSGKCGICDNTPLIYHEKISKIKNTHTSVQFLAPVLCCRLTYYCQSKGGY